MRSKECSGNVAATESKSPVSRYPPPRPRPVVHGGVGLGHAGELAAHLDGGQMPGLSHGVQQVDAHRAGTGAGFEHGHAGADVAELDDLGDVLRIHDLRAARHGEHIVGQARAHDGELPSADGARALPRLAGVALRMLRVDLRLAFGADGDGDAAFGPSDHLIMQDQAVFGLGGAARHQLVGDLLAPAVGELHLLARLQRPSAHARPFLVADSSPEHTDWGGIGPHTPHPATFHAW